MAGDKNTKVQSKALDGLADQLSSAGRVLEIEQRHRLVESAMRDAIAELCKSHGTEPFNDDQRAVIVLMFGEMVKMIHNGKPKGFVGRQVERFKDAEMGAQWAVGGVILAALGGALSGAFWFSHTLLAEHVDAQVQRAIESHHLEQAEGATSSPPGGR